MGKLPSKACWTLLFKVWVLEAETEEGPPPEDGGLEVRLIITITVSDCWGYGYRNNGSCTCVCVPPTGAGAGGPGVSVVCARAAESERRGGKARCGFGLQIMCVMSCNVMWDRYAHT
jgi:hypothetical protein